MAARRPWRMAIPLLVVLGLALLWSVYWYVVYSQTQQFVARAEADMAAKGMALACARREWGGYPFRVEFRCTEPRFTAPAQGGEMALGSGEVNLVMQAWNFKHVIGLIDGPTQGTLPGVIPIELQHKRAAASFRMADADRFVAGFELPEASMPGRFEAKSITANAEADLTGLARIEAAADDVTFTLENGRFLPLKQAGAVLTLPSAVLTAADPLAAAAASGAPLTIERFDFSGQGFSLAVHGSMHLDADSLLNGKLTATTADIDKLLIALEPVLGVKAQELSMVRAAIMLTNDNRAGGVTIHISADRGAVKVGFFPIATLPPLRH